MTTKDNFTTTIRVDQTPEAVFAAINHVRGWWIGDIEGSTDKLGDEFTYRHGDVHYSKQKITELVPHEKIVWLVLDSELNFTEDKSEWNGTEIRFEIVKKGNQTDVHFTHVGLVPDYECFESCSSAWGYYIKSSLANLIATASEQPSS